MMQAYTEEQRAELIAELKTEKAVLEKWRDDWNARDKVNYSAICIALSALTAAPVYQVEVHGGWADVSEEDFEAAIYKGEKTRNLYTAPPVAAPAVPAVWKLVPVDPTQEMVWAAKNELSSTVGWESFKEAYKSMLAAAPEKPQ